MSQSEILIDNEILAQLDATALATNQSREAALDEAIRNYIEYDRYFRESVEAGLKDIEEGRVFSDEEVQAETKSIIEEIRNRKKACK